VTADQPPPAIDPATLAAMSFEDALSELETIVQRLETGRGKLADAIQDYERGVALHRHCEQALRDARMRVEAITRNGAGDLETEPLDP